MSIDALLKAEQNRLSRDVYNNDTSSRQASADMVSLLGASKAGKLEALCHAYANAQNEDDAATLIGLITDAAGGM